MRRYKSVEVSERQLEEMIRKAPDLIEEGLQYVDHQRRTDRGPLDVFLVDSGHSLVVAELKVVEDDGMLVQGIDYYDYVVSNTEGLARAYKGSHIDPAQKLRLFLIAPSFSISLLNRCKWIDIPISLFLFQCIAFEDDPKEIVPVFSEVTIPSMPTKPEAYSLQERLAYITDDKVRRTVQRLLSEIQDWDKDNILIEPIKYEISVKMCGRVIAYVGPRRTHFIVYTYDADAEWKGFPVRSEQDVKETMILVKANFEKQR